MTWPPGPMNITALKIVLDTNILIAIIGRRSPYRWIFDALIDGQLSLCVSTDILYEYREILERKTSLEMAENILNFVDIHPATLKTTIYFKFNLLDDPDDNKFVDCFIASNAEFIVSNDGHFQKLKGLGFPQISVLKLDEFVEKFRDSLAA